GIPVLGHLLVDKDFNRIAGEQPPEEEDQRRDEEDREERPEEATDKIDAQKSIQAGLAPDILLLGRCHALAYRRNHSLSVPAPAPTRDTSSLVESRSRTANPRA